MNRNYMFSLMAVFILFLIAYVGVAAVGLQVLFGIVIPYVAIIIFTLGFMSRVVGWARSAVPFRIPTTCGQQKSLPWIRQNTIDNPSTQGGVFLRMLLEIVTFRSLFRNTKFRIRDGEKPFYGLEIFLWLGALAFHYAFATVLVRHLRFFMEPVPLPIKLLESVDSFLQVGLPGVMLSGIVLLAAVTYLALRRVLIAQVRYISLASDYFPLFLIFGIALTGILMRYFIKVDVVNAKALAFGLVSFHPTVPQGIGAIFYVHLFFVCVLLAYFPFSKLMHLGGIFFSPTRNMTANTREVRHVNPWNHPVKVHTYEEYEDEFRERMVEVGLPVDKELPPEPPEAEEPETAAETPEEKE
jgi:nitrate reductase gamma subunit